MPQINPKNRLLKIRDVKGGGGFTWTLCGHKEEDAAAIQQRRAHFPHRRVTIVAQLEKGQPYSFSLRIHRGGGGTFQNRRRGPRQQKFEATLNI
jgi:hypothetical protein